jgi:hypothetical protein
MLLYSAHKVFLFHGSIDISYVLYVSPTGRACSVRGRRRALAISLLGDVCSRERTASPDFERLQVRAAASSLSDMGASNERRHQLPDLDCDVMWT